MSFKTLDGVTVYDKRDVDAIKEDIDSRMLDRQELETALNTKATKAEVAALVSQSVDAMISSKLAIIESDINHIVNNAVNNAIGQNVSNMVNNSIEQELQNYDDSNTVDQKIATAANGLATEGYVDNALEGYDNSNTVDQKIATAANGLATKDYVDQAVAAIPNPGVASAADVNAIVDQYF